MTVTGEKDNASVSIKNVESSKDMITAKISDGRTISIPTAWFTKLDKATLLQLKNFEISPSGYGIHWPEIDEDISIKAFINSDRAYGIIK